MSIKFDQTIMKLLKDVNDIKAALRHITTNLPLYDVANENTPTSLATDQNNYVPGNYDVLRINATTNISITGIANGKKGRFLHIFNIGTGKITLPHESTSSLAANRFDVIGDEDIVIFPTASVLMYYDDTTSRWLIQDRPKWLGTYGVSMRATAASQSIGDSGAVGSVKLTGFTETTDEWNLFDTANSKFVIPETGLYMGVISLGFDANAIGYRQLAWRTGGVNVSVQSYPAVTSGGVQTFFSCPIFRSFTADDEIEIYATQDSGGSLNTNNTNLAFTRIL